MTELPVSLEEFAIRFKDERDDLTLRKIQGDYLTPDELDRLAVLDKHLVRLLPKHEPLPADVQALIDEIMRRPE